MRAIRNAVLLATLAGACLGAGSAYGVDLFQRRKTGGKKKEESAEYREEISARRLLRQAQLYEKMGKLKDAEATYVAVGDRYPNTKTRFDAWLELGRFYHERRQYDKAVNQFERITRAAANAEEDVGEDLVVKALVKAGESFFEAGQYNQCISKMRRVVNDYGDREEANDAYYYIGLCHFKRKNWINAIRSLRLVGTNLPPDEGDDERLEARKRLFIKVEDADLSVLKKEGEGLRVAVETPRGDKESILLKPLTLKGDVYIGDVATILGEPNPGDETVQVYGVDSIHVSYVDANTADHQRNVQRLKETVVVGNAAVAFVDGAFKDTVGKVVLGEPAFLRVVDYDADLSVQKDQVQVTVRSLRPLPREEDEGGLGLESAEPEKQRYETRDELRLTVEELAVPEPTYSKSGREALARENLKSEKEWKDPKKREEALAKADAFIKKQLELHKKNLYHSGTFGGQLRVEELGEGMDADRTDTRLMAAPGDVLEIEYVDRHHTEGDTEKVASARAGTLKPKDAPVDVINKIVREKALKIQKLLQEAKALLDLGKIFEELGLTDRATERYDEGLKALDDIAAEKNYPQRMKEEMYYVRSQLNLAKGDLQEASTILTKLLQEFPESEFGEGALMQLAKLSIEQGEHLDGIRFYETVLRMPTSSRKAEAQFLIGETYVAWGEYEVKKRGYGSEGGGIAPTYGQSALKAYEKCASEYPETLWAGKAVVKVANFYLARQNYKLAIEKFEKILEEYEDTTDVVPYVLLHYGRCLYKLERYRDALEKWQQIIVNYPSAEEAGKAKRYITAVERKVG